ncbi:spermidine synthase [Paenibacillus flagellatus]|uniref:Spermidine synthase n=1 Tax=Paenibacillus flagellatus TaxID=2211139 RepID=A0A2V5KD94_9BACL|nr:fused MFS/spermidine synthase [Paenibacillus flagellatus]PYI51870.1 spermidine synthase [Paenibacillus flagellatus]
MHVLYKEFGDECEITVYDTAELDGEKGRFRVLQFSEAAIQGAIDLNKPDRVLLEYQRAIIHLMKTNNPAFEDAFVVGHGIGTIASHFSDKRFRVAELDARVAEVSRLYFGYRLDNVTVGDGRLLLAGERPGAFDFIVLDAFTDRGTPRHLTSRAFFELTKEKLAPHGAIVVNAFGKNGRDPLIDDLHATLGASYPYTKAFATPGRSAGLRNVLLVGGGRPSLFQERHMAGFAAIAPGAGSVITDA